MILASIESELALLVGMFVFAVAMAISIPIGCLVLLGRHIRKDYRRQGGAPALAKKMAGGIASQVIKRWFFGRFR